MGSIVHRSVPTNLKWFRNCSHAHALFKDRFKDVQVGSRWFSTLYILSPNFHTMSISPPSLWIIVGRPACISARIATALFLHKVRSHSSRALCARVSVCGGTFESSCYP